MAGTVTNRMKPRVKEEFLDEIRRVDFAFMDRSDWGALFEEITKALYCAVLRPGDVAVDCGTNIGDHTRIMARNVGPSGKVYSFEAVGEMIEKAKSRLTAFNNIVWVNRALSSRAGTEITFNYYPDEDGLSSIKEREGTSVHVPISVLTTTIDSNIKEDVALMKLDIEGGELHALMGAKRVLQTSRPVLIFENGRQAAAELFGYSMEDFFQFFEKIGYLLFFISGMPLMRENWNEPNHPWQFLALHPTSPRFAQALSVTHDYRGFLGV